MKLFNRFSVMAAIVSTLVLAGCTDDVYDPERGIQTVPKENPLGEDFSAPDSFDWSMINAVNLNVEVKDEFNGRYKYLIEVFTDNPLTSSLRTPKIFVKEFSYFLMPCHQHCLGVNLLVQRQPNLYGCDCLSQCKDLVYAHLNL